MDVKAIAASTLAALSLSGCAMVGDLGATGLAENIEDNAATLNVAHTRAMTAIIAINVLRARDRWPTNYTTLSGIKSNPTLAMGGSASFGPLGLGNAAGPFKNSSASVSRSETANAEYSVNPFSNNDKTQGLLKPIQPEMMQGYWQAGWPRETLMWLFVDSISFSDASGVPSEVWRIDGDEFRPETPAKDREFANRYVDLIQRAKDGEIDFEMLPMDSLDARGCTPYDPGYVRDTLGGASPKDSIKDTIQAVESLTGKRLVLAPDTRAPKTGESAIASDKFNRRFLLCDPREAYWGFVDAKTKAVLARATMRSFDDMIYFLGETLRSAGPDGATEIGGMTLFHVYRERGGRQYAVRVEHAGQVYFIAPQMLVNESHGVKDLTGNVLSLLNQLYLLAQSDEFLRAPEARLR